MPPITLKLQGYSHESILNDPAALWSIVALTLVIFGGGYLILRFLKSTRG